jgi:uncharacterized membrane protein YjfL (UPF0719 family)
LAISSENYVPAILNYLLHLLTAAALVLAFFVVYTRITPYDEVALIRAGNGAAALSLGGSLIGFSITIASTVATTASYYQFAGWAVGAMIVQLVVWVVATRLLRMSRTRSRRIIVPSAACWARSRCRSASSTPAAFPEPVHRHSSRRHHVLGSFIKKQFIDVIQWNEDSEGVLAWRFPMQDFEIQNGGQLVVRESQVAVFVNEGTIADVFGPGTHTLTTRTLPVLTNLKNWDKLFDSPFKSDVYFFSTRVQTGRKWGTPQPITIRDKDFDMIRVRAFGMYSYRVADARAFFTEISGTREAYTRDEVEDQLRGIMLASMASSLGGANVAFLDMAANQALMAQQVGKDLAWPSPATASSWTSSTWPASACRKNCRRRSTSASRPA